MNDRISPSLVSSSTRSAPARSSVFHTQRGRDCCARRPQRHRQIYDLETHQSLVLAHQYLTQLELNIRDAILGNAGTTIVFRIGGNDAEILESEFTPEFKAADFTNLPNYHIYLKLMIDGKISRPFSAVTLPPG